MHKLSNQNVHVIAKHEDVKDILPQPAQNLKVGFQDGFVVVTGHCDRICHESPMLLDKALKIIGVEFGSERKVNEFMKSIGPLV